MSTERFVLQAIERLRTDRSRGIHTVFTGFNRAFRIYYKGVDPVKAVDELVEQGLLKRKFVRGGAMIYKADEAPAGIDSRTSEEVLAAIVR